MSDSATVPQFLIKKSGGAGRKTSDNRRRFLDAYERSFGNISASCEIAGISRRTFYRWMKSDTPINRKFRQSIEAVKPKEKFVDWVESKLVERINVGDTTAIIFALKTQGGHRGYGEDARVDSKQLGQSNTSADLTRDILAKIRSRAADKGVSFKVEARSFLTHFASKLPADVRTAIEEAEARSE